LDSFFLLERRVFLLLSPSFDLTSYKDGTVHHMKADEIEEYFDGVTMQ